MFPFLVYVSNRQVRNAFSIFTFPPNSLQCLSNTPRKKQNTKVILGPTQDMFLCRKPVSLCIMTNSKTLSFPRPQLFLLSSPLLLVENAQIISEITGQCV